MQCSPQAATLRDFRKKNWRTRCLRSNNPKKIEIWRTKSQEEWPVRAQEQALTQMDF